MSKATRRKYSPNHPAVIAARLEADPQPISEECRYCGADPFEDCADDCSRWVIRSLAERTRRLPRPLAEPFYRVPMTCGLMCLVSGIVAFGTGPGLFLLGMACVFLFPAIAGWADTLDKE